MSNTNGDRKTGSDNDKDEDDPPGAVGGEPTDSGESCSGREGWEEGGSERVKEGG